MITLYALRSIPVFIQSLYVSVLGFFCLFVCFLNEDLTLFLQPCVWEEKEGNTCKGV